MLIKTVGPKSQQQSAQRGCTFCFIPRGKERHGGERLAGGNYGFHWKGVVWRSVRCGRQPRPVQILSPSRPVLQHNATGAAMRVVNFNKRSSTAREHSFLPLAKYTSPGNVTNTLTVHMEYEILRVRSRYFENQRCFFMRCPFGLCQKDHSLC